MLLRLALTTLFLCTLLAPAVGSADDNPVIVITLGGNTSTDIHAVVKEKANADGCTMTQGQTWAKDKGDVRATRKDAERVLEAIEGLVGKNGGQQSALNLLVVGKSAGGVLAWNLFKQFYSSDLSQFHRVALVMVDPHGSVAKDKNAGPYGGHQDLYWVDGWSSDKSKLRIINVFQHRKKLKGASFPDSRVHRNVQVTSDSVTHDNITTSGPTKKAVGEALHYVFHRKW